MEFTLFMRELSYSKGEISFPLWGWYLGLEALSEIFLFGSGVVLCQLVPPVWVFSFCFEFWNSPGSSGPYSRSAPTLGLHLD